MSLDKLDDYGLCECGCGGRAPLAHQSDTARGHIKGAPLRFIRGHRARLPNNRVYQYGSLNASWKGGRLLATGGYIRVRNPDHPRAIIGYVLEHILIAEKALGRFLPHRAVVHHANEIEEDNRNCNLIICEDQAYHMLLHQRRRAFLASGHAEYLKCQFCQRYDDPSTMCVNIKHAKHYHVKCRPSRSMGLRCGA